jgi:hypothetical protein
MAVKNAKWKRSKITIQQLFRILAAACSEVLSRSSGAGPAARHRSRSLRFCGYLLLASGFVVGELLRLGARRLRPPLSEFQSGFIVHKGASQSIIILLPNRMQGSGIREKWTFTPQSRELGSALMLI